MSAPRHFESVPDILRAAQEHGLKTRRATTGHWQILQDRTGMGPNRIVSTLPGTTSMSHRLIKNELARVKRATGIDLRFPPKVKPKEPTQQPDLVLLKPPEPAPAPKTSRLADAIKVAIKEALTELVRELVTAVQAPQVTPPPTPVEPKTPPPSIYEELPPDEKATSGRLRRQNLTDQEIKEIVQLYATGESLEEINRTYNLARGYVYKILARHAPDTPRVRRRGAPKTEL